MAKKILIFNRHYLPGFKAGGPIRSLANIIERLSGIAEFYLVTTDRDLLDTVQYPDIVIGKWTVVGNARVYYLPAHALSMRTLRQLIHVVAPDQIYLNSFFDPFFTGRILVARRLGLIPDIQMILAPRGEFSAGAISLKRSKKLFYLSMFKISRVWRGLIWHASTVHEANDINRNAPHDPGSIRIATDLGPIVDNNLATRWKRRSDNEPLRICFLSRISPKKNLLLALQALQICQTSVLFHIYGPKEDVDYWSECERVIGSLAQNISVAYEGVVPHEDVRSTLARYDLFFLPTLGENFGHVVIEALSAGVPVLISDQTPWQDIQVEGVGWVVSNSDRTEYADYVAAMSQMSLSEQMNLRQRCIGYAQRCLSDQAAVAENVALFAS